MRGREIYRLLRPPARDALPAACLTFVAAHADATVAQSCLTPPYHSGTTLYTSSWPNDTGPIAVKIGSEYNADQRRAIQNGIASWNATLSCANLQFAGFSPEAGLSPTNPPPHGTVHVVRFGGVSANADYLAFETGGSGRIGKVIIRFHPEKTDPPSLGGRPHTRPDTR